MPNNDDVWAQPTSVAGLCTLHQDPQPHTFKISAEHAGAKRPHPPTKKRQLPGQTATMPMHSPLQQAPLLAHSTAHPQVCNSRCGSSRPHSNNATANNQDLTGSCLVQFKATRLRVIAQTASCTACASAGRTPVQHSSATSRMQLLPLSSRLARPLAVMPAQ
jgi:hypothetical protein